MYIYLFSHLADAFIKSDLQINIYMSQILVYAILPLKLFVV